MRYLLGIDLGTSGTKTVLFDECGAVIASSTQEYPLYQPKNGWAEQDPMDWYEAAINTIKKVINISAVDPKDIVALSIAGQMHGLVMIDKDGQILGKSILWCDSRTAKQCEEITNKVGAQRLIEINANPALTGFTAPKILWVREHLPELYAKCDCILLPKDFVRYMFTGQKAIEISDASGTNLLDIKQRIWSKEILQALDIDEKLLPKIIESADVAGFVSKEVAALTGLNEGTIVAGGAGDNAAAALGTGVCKEGQAFVTLGTSGVVFAHTSKPAIDVLGRVHTFCAAVPNAWTAMSCTLAAGLSLRWVRDEFYTQESKMCSDIYDVMTQEAATIPTGSDGLIYLPYLMGERSPILDPNARGVFFGLSARHSKAHLTRAVIEGITLSQRHNLEVLNNMGIKPKTLAACGGGANSLFWRQMLADCLKIKVTTIQSKEGPALGAAILAGVAAKVYPSIEDACENIVKANDNSYLPNAVDSAKYDAIFDLYQFLYPSLRPAFNKLSTLRSKLDEESVEKYPSVFSVEFERYGRILNNVNTEAAVKILKTLPCPKDGTVYEPSEPQLEKALLKDLELNDFGGLPLEVGYCSGYNKKLNCLEYHRNCEIDITATDMLFMLAPVTAIKNGVIDSASVETFFAPANIAILFYETSLHYAPCVVEGGSEFRMAVVLPKGTNTQKPEGIDDSAENQYLTNKNKWLFAHQESDEFKANITKGLVIGKNLTV